MRCSFMLIHMEGADSSMLHADHARYQALVFLPHMPRSSWLGCMLCIPNPWRHRILIHPLP